MVVSVAAAPFVGVGSAGFAAASAGLSSVFLLFFPLNKLLSLAFKSESAFGAVRSSQSIISS